MCCPLLSLHVLHLVPPSDDTNRKCDLTPILRPRSSLQAKIGLLQHSWPQSLSISNVTSAVVLTVPSPPPCLLLNRAQLGQPFVMPDLPLSDFPRQGSWELM
ncbi:hypothetical protein M3J09_003289 [Ascochyta lentis]